MWLLDGPPQNTQLVAKEEELNLMVDPIHFEHDQIDHEA